MPRYSRTKAQTIVLRNRKGELFQAINNLDASPGIKYQLLVSANAYICSSKRINVKSFKDHCILDIYREDCIQRMKFHTYTTDDGIEIPCSTTLELIDL